MTILKSMPSPVQSVEALLSLACSLEKQATRRYLELAASMRLREEGRLAALFEFLASIEDKHAAAIVQRAGQIIGVAALTEVPTEQMPESFDAEAGESSLLTPYRALAIAVHNETRAFTLYSYLAAISPNESVRQLAEELAKDELGHADLLRRERRKAYRAQKSAPRRARAQLPQTSNELWSLCLETEARAACYHRALAELLRAQDDAVATAFSEAADDEASCARQAVEHIGRSLRESTEQPIAPTVSGGRRLLEEAFERYTDIAGRAGDEAVMQQALLLAERASRRLFVTSLALTSSTHK